MNSIVVHHSADFDGLACREVALHHLRKMGKNPIVIGWDYGNPIPTELADLSEADWVYLLDISLDSEMERLAASWKLVWCDHHKSALDKWSHLKRRGLCIDGVGACRLAWQYFTNDDFPVFDHFRKRTVEEPAVIRLLGEHDVFDHRDPQALPLQFGLKALSPEQQSTFLREQIERFGTSDTEEAEYELEQVAIHGRIIQSYVNRINAEHARKHSHTVRWEDLTWCVLNTGSPGNSQMFEGAYTSDHDALMAWRYDGKQAYVSFYHRPGREDLDLSVIAMKHGGGGHRGACGVRCPVGRLIQWGVLR
jgi:hypothetical protein